jgi:hypothetical protein
LSVPFNPLYSYNWSTGDTTASVYVSDFSSYNIVVTDILSGCQEQSAANGTVVVNALPSDVNFDGITNITDFNLVLGSFNTTCSGCPVDINNDTFVNITDFNYVLGQLGQVCQ